MLVRCSVGVGVLVESRGFVRLGRIVGWVEFLGGFGCAVRVGDRLMISGLLVVL